MTTIRAFVREVLSALWTDAWIYLVFIMVDFVLNETSHESNRFVQGVIAVAGFFVGLGPSGVAAAYYAPRFGGGPVSRWDGIERYAITQLQIIGLELGVTAACFGLAAGLWYIGKFVWIISGLTSLFAVLLVVAWLFALFAYPPRLTLAPFVRVLTGDPHSIATSWKKTIDRLWWRCFIVEIAFFAVGFVIFGLATLLHVTMHRLHVGTTSSVLWAVADVVESIVLARLYMEIASQALSAPPDLEPELF
jgi:hypothetical protein